MLGVSYKDGVLELNASGFHKIVILDEADSLTEGA